MDTWTAPRHRIIGLSGYARSGKDTVAAHLERNWGYERRAFADALKDIACALDPLVELADGGTSRLAGLVERVGWEAAKRHPDVRRLLQRLGQSVRDRCGEDTWLDVVMTDISARPRAHYAISDVRYVNEAEAIRDAGGALWRIERPGVRPVNSHLSESSLDDWPFDVVLDNDSDVKALYEKVDRMLGGGIAGHAPRNNQIPSRPWHTTPSPHS